MSNKINFNRRTPHILVVDDFYSDPTAILNEARQAQYEENDKLFKGKRTPYKFLYPYVKEEFERLLQASITDWINQPMNGIFQITSSKDPIVWHSDTQDYAGAIYLSSSSLNEGTSFWRHKQTHCRRPPNHPMEANNPRIQDDLSGKYHTNHLDEIYSEYNLLHEDNWELVDRVGCVFNRLVLWDAKLIHSATQYGNNDRLAQLFFFSIHK